MLLPHLLGLQTEMNDLERQVLEERKMQLDKISPMIEKLINVVANQTSHGKNKNGSGLTAEDDEIISGAVWGKIVEYMQSCNLTAEDHQKAKSFIETASIMGKSSTRIQIDADTQISSLRNYLKNAKVVVGMQLKRNKDEKAALEHVTISNYLHTFQKSINGFLQHFTDFSQDYEQRMEYLYSKIPSPGSESDPSPINKDNIRKNIREADAIIERKSEASIW